MEAVRIPTYRQQKGKPFSRAFVELDGCRIYLGRWETPESREKYHRTIAEWMANGRHLKSEPDEVTVNEIAGAFWEHAHGNYRRAGGTPITESLDGYKRALAPLRRLYGTVSAVKFGPMALR